MSQKNRDKAKNKGSIREKETKVNFKNYSSNNTWTWVGLSIIFITTFVVYSKAIKFDFLLTWDDYLYITENTDIKELNWANIKLFFTKYYANNYHPLTMLFYAIEYNISSGLASIFHLNNILLHLLNTYLVFIFIKKISPNHSFVALITSAFFAVHPMHVESVAWVSERKDVLYSFFFLLSLIMYCKYLESQKIKYLLVTIIFFVLSCLSKSAAVIFPLVMFLLDYYSNRKYTSKIIFEKLPFLIVSLIFGYVAIQSQKGAIQDMAPSVTLIEHISIVSFSLINYLFKAIIPINLTAIYPYPLELGGGILPIGYYICILLLFSLIFLIGYSIRFGKETVFGFLFFLITIILVLQIIQVGGASMAERYTYIPYIGIFFCIGKLLENLFFNVNSKFKKQNKYSLPVLISVFFLFSSISYGRVKMWENGDILFSDAINKYPNSSIVYRIRGDYYLTYYTKKTDVNDKITRMLYLNKSILDYENALNFLINQYDNTIIKYGLGNAYSNRGFEKYLLKNYNGALEDFNKVIKFDEKNPITYFSIGTIKNELQDYNGAINAFDKAIQIDSNYVSAYNNRGSAQFNLRNYEDALKDFNKAIQLKSDYYEAIKNRDLVISFMKSPK